VKCGSGGEDRGKTKGYRKYWGHRRVEGAESPGVSCAEEGRFFSPGFGGSSEGWGPGVSWEGS